MTTWRARAGRSEGTPEDYSFGDITRIIASTTRDIWHGTAEGTREITGGIVQRYNEEQYGIAAPAAADPGPSGTAIVASPPSAAPPSGAASGKASLLDKPQAMPGAASGGTAALGSMAKGAGVVWGAGKELVLGAGLGVAKGAVALVDKGVEAAAPMMMTQQQQQQAEQRINALSRSVAAEMAPVLGAMASQFASGAMEGMSQAQQGMGKAYETIVPGHVQARRRGAEGAEARGVEGQRGRGGEAHQRTAPAAPHGRWTWSRGWRRGSAR